MKSIATLLILFFVICVSIADAQKRKIPKSDQIRKKETVNRQIPTICGGGVVNKLAMVLPKPVFSNEAKLAGAKGVVSVQVKVDEEGNVIETRACSGDLQLRDAAVEAAKQAKFKPTILSGNPVKVSGIIIYNFGLENSKDESPAKVTNENVVVLPCPPSKGFRILNNYAINLVKPEYPQELKERKVQGGIVVQILLDEQGKLISASANAGPQELRNLAVEAVKKSTFKRFILCGKPTHIIGGIIYNFIP